LWVPETRERQAELAREAGLYGFCYWHYWFGNGKRLLDRVFREVVESGKPDFPFCLCWANHSWYKKTWVADAPDKILVEQTYPGDEDYIAHFKELLPAFKDSRYIRNSEGKLVFGIFAPKYFKDFKNFKKIWHSLAEENGLNGFEFFAYTFAKKTLDFVKPMCYDRVVLDALKDSFEEGKRFSFKWLKQKINQLMHKPQYLITYSSYVHFALKRFKEISGVTPCICPMFDHSPRSNGRGLILDKNNPILWGELCCKTKKLVESNACDNDKMIFVKAWNEWGEGNYMEPDSRFGRAYIEEAGKVFGKNTRA
jgi:hypothetical protein